MSLLWCDGFDHYGILGNLTEGAWAQNNGNCTLVTTNPRTGTHHLRHAGNSSQAGLQRRVLGGAKTTVGLAGVFYLSSLPSTNDRFCPFVFNDAANANQVTIVIQSTGVIEAKRGSRTGTSLGVSASPAVTAEAYQHIECMVFFSQTVGTVEVRVNGVTVLSISGADTVATSLVECSQVVFFSSSESGLNTETTVPQADLDDVFCYDSAGSFNNTFIGDRRVLTLFPNADTIQADWTPVGAANGYDCINDTTPDGDTTYITASVPGSPGPISEFGIENLPAGISAISAVVLVEMARKTEAGDANTQWSVVSGASETAGADKPLTEVYTYRQDVFETDPASAAPFTPSEVDALLIKVERTA